MKKYSRLAIVLVVVALIGAAVVLGGIHQVPEGFIGVTYFLGRLSGDLVPPGIGVHIPFVESVDAIDVREQVFAEKLQCYTRDTQTVEEFSIKLNYIYERGQLQDLIRTVGIYNVAPNIITPLVHTICKNETGKYRAEDLISQRATIQASIQEALFERLMPYGIRVVSFAVENIEFEDTFEASIRAKVQAEQEALRARNKTLEIEELARQEVISAEATAQAKILNADAEAHAIRVIQEELARSEHYVNYMMIEKWDGTLPQVMGNTVNPFLNLGTMASGGIVP
ncbi:MAG: prohibitin family protein [Symbiobacteriaceae bacterium]|nr:prohibitin family protein [Symbiobacteriaceae bacterium]